MRVKRGVGVTAPSRLNTKAVNLPIQPQNTEIGLIIDDLHPGRIPGQQVDFLIGGVGIDVPRGEASAENFLPICRDANPSSLMGDDIDLDWTTAEHRQGWGDGRLNRGN